MLKPSLPLTFILEMKEVRANLNRLHQENNYGWQKGVASYNARRGDVVSFHQSPPIGRMAFAQESGIYCNLDQK